MNQPSPSTTEAAPAAVPSLEERTAGVYESLDDATSQSAGELGEASPPAQAPPQVAPADSDPAAAQRAVERRQRLADMAAKAREQVDRKAAQAAQDKMARDYADAQRRADEAEKLAANRVDVSQLDEAAFFRLAEQRNIKPERLGEWIREAMSNPAKQAEAAALQAQKTTYDPKLAALEARIAQQDAQIREFLQNQQEAQAAVVEQQQTRAFLGFVSQSKERAPLASALLASDESEFLTIASLAAEKVAGLGPEALLDAVEDLLDGSGRQVAETYARLYGIIPSQQSAHTPPPTRGAAQPKTVSNSLAQERASVVEDDDFAKLPIEERAARLIRSM